MFLRPSGSLRPPAHASLKISPARRRAPDFPEKSWRAARSKRMLQRGILLYYEFSGFFRPFIIKSRMSYWNNRICFVPALYNLYFHVQFFIASGGKSVNFLSCFSGVPIISRCNVEKTAPQFPFCYRI
jgi:hypothetical protein